MPNGAKHLKISGITGCACVCAATLISTDVGLIIAAGAGSLWASLITPDLDVDGGNITVAKIRQRLGRPAAAIYRCATYPYSKLASHRGASHTPIFGTFWRIIYFYSVGTLIADLAKFAALGTGAFASYADFLPISVPYTDYAMHIYVWFFVCACIVDLAHIAADYITTKIKRLKSRRSRKSINPMAKQRASLRDALVRTRGTRP